MKAPKVEVDVSEKDPAHEKTRKGPQTPQSNFLIKLKGD
jgi:hypothetical protein